MQARILTSHRAICLIRKLSEPQGNLCLQPVSFYAALGEFLIPWENQYHCLVTTMHGTVLSCTSGAMSFPYLADQYNACYRTPGYWIPSNWPTIVSLGVIKLDCILNLAESYMKNWKSCCWVKCFKRSCMFVFHLAIYPSALFKQQEYF